jgi:general secretion pathway protein C
MLDLFFKKYAWTANLVLLFAAAWLSARTVNTVIGALIRPRPSIDLAAGPAQAPKPAPARAGLDANLLYYLIGLKPPPPPDTTPQAGPAAPPPKPQNCADRTISPVKTALRAQLVAGVVSDRPSQSIASITDLNTRETRVYGVGDIVLGTRIMSIERLRDERDATGAGFKVVAIVCNDGRKEYVDFEPGDGSAAPAAVASFTPRPGAAPPADEEATAASEGVKKVDANKYEVKKSFIDSTLGNLNKVATEARIVPSFKNGVANGFKLFSIQPGSLYSAIGVENGDVIQRINGYEINSPDKALEVYQKLRESSHISIEIERNGQIIRKEYNVTGS